MKKLFKNEKGFSHFEAVLLLLIVAAIAVVGVYVAKNRSSQVSAAPTMPPNATLMAGQLWMIKDNDLKVIGNVGQYEWTGCGLTTGTPLNSPNYAPCQAGQTPIFTSEATFAADINNKAKIPAGTSYVIYDDEKWALTPKVEKNNAIEYIQKAIALAHSHGLKIINTPYAGKPQSIINRDVAAAKAGADVVEIQAQTLDGAPTAYKNFVTKDVDAIRAVNSNVIILSGLATDAGGTPVGVSDIYQEYKAVKGEVQGFWLNANVWAPPTGKGCAPQGCPTTAVAFLKEIGAIQ